MELHHSGHQPTPVTLRSGFDQKVERVDSSTLSGWIDSGGVFLVDVREPQEFEDSRISGTFLVPMSRFDTATFPRVSGLKTVLICQSGRRAHALGDRLADSGFDDVYFLDGGISAWLDAGFETED